jgi:hypothetical protein
MKCVSQARHMSCRAMMMDRAGNQSTWISNKDVTRHVADSITGPLFSRGDYVLCKQCHKVRTSIEYGLFRLRNISMPWRLTKTRSPVFQ